MVTRGEVTDGMDNLTQLLSKFAELPFADQDDILQLIECFEPTTVVAREPTVLFKKKYDDASLEILSKAYNASPHDIDRFFRGTRFVLETNRVLFVRLLIQATFSISLLSFHTDVIIPQFLTHNCNENITLLAGDVEVRAQSGSNDLIFDLIHSDTATIESGARHRFQCAANSTCLSACFTEDVDSGWHLRGKTFNMDAKSKRRHSSKRLYRGRE